jgi:hypothetical protein
MIRCCVVVAGGGGEKWCWVLGLRGLLTRGRGDASGNAIGRQHVTARLGFVGALTKKGLGTHFAT